MGCIAWGPHSCCTHSWVPNVPTHSAIEAHGETEARGRELKPPKCPRPPSSSLPFPLAVFLSKALPTRLLPLPNHTQGCVLWFRSTGDNLNLHIVTLGTNHALCLLFCCYLGLSQGMLHPDPLCQYVPSQQPHVKLGSRAGGPLPDLSAFLPTSCSKSRRELKASLS